VIIHSAAKSDSDSFDKGKVLIMGQNLDGDVVQEIIGLAGLFSLSERRKGVACLVLATMKWLKILQLPLFDIITQLNI